MKRTYYFTRDDATAALMNGGYHRMMAGVEPDDWTRGDGSYATIRRSFLRILFHSNSWCVSITPQPAR